MQNTLQQDLPRRLPSNRPYAQQAQPAQHHAAHLQAQILACVATPTAILEADAAPLPEEAGLAIPADQRVSQPVFFSRANFHRSSSKRGIELSTMWLRGGITR